LGATIGGVFHGKVYDHLIKRDPIETVAQRDEKLAKNLIKLTALSGGIAGMGVGVVEGYMANKGRAKRNQILFSKVGLAGSAGAVTGAATAGGFACVMLGAVGAAKAYYFKQEPNASKKIKPSP